MPRLFLVRHSQAGEQGRYYGRRDIPLSPEGLRQAERLRERLSGEVFHAIYSSDLQRALHTARAIASAHQIPVVPCPELREIDFGELEGLTFEEIQKCFPGNGFWEGRSPAPGGEGLGNLAARVGSFLERLQGHREGEMVLLVAHSGPLRVMLCQLLGLGAEKWWCFHLAPASLSLVETHAGGAILSLLNDLSHLGLPGKAIPRGKCVLLLGGARSGKSRFAQELAALLGERVLFVATGAPLDEEMRARIEEHRNQRPAYWQTLEAPLHVGKRIAEVAGDSQVVILDCLTFLVSNGLFELAGEKDLEEVDSSRAEKHLESELKELRHCIDSLSASFIIVSNEVGTGVVPMSRSGRLFQNLLGRANQALAERADEVYLMTAGIPHLIKGCRV